MRGESLFKLGVADFRSFLGPAPPAARHGHRGRRPVDGWGVATQVRPAVLGVLRQRLAAGPAVGKPLGAPDRAMLVAGFDAALHRSELMALALRDIETAPGCGPLLTTGYAKTDLNGAVHAKPPGPGCGTGMARPTSAGRLASPSVLHDGCSAP